jgi:hypothetical protein
MIGKIIDYKSEAFNYEFRLIVEDIDKRGEVFSDLHRKLDIAQHELECDLMQEPHLCDMDVGGFVDLVEEVEEYMMDLDKMRMELDEARAEINYLKCEQEKRTEELLSMRIAMVDTTVEIGILRDFIRDVI